MGQPTSSQIKPFVITHELDAPRDLAFKVWTEADHLKHWMSPKGYVMTKCENDLRPGGIFHYCLRSPEGKEMWGKWTYREIVPPERIVLVNSFSDILESRADASSLQRFLAARDADHEHLHRKQRANLCTTPMDSAESDGRGTSHLRRRTRRNEDGLGRNLRTSRRLPRDAHKAADASRKGLEEIPALRYVTILPTRLRPASIPLQVLLLLLLPKKNSSTRNR